MNACPVFGYCLNHAECFDCCGGLPLGEAADSTLPLLYLKMCATDPAHPVVEVRKVRKRDQLQRERDRKRSTAFRTNSMRVRKALRNERGTRDEIIRATHRSGASNGDGDSRLGDGQWGVDDKYYCVGNSQFTVKLKDIDKARSQKCVIIVTVKNGAKYVVAELNDFCSSAQAMIAALESVTK